MAVSEFLRKTSSLAMTKGGWRRRVKQEEEMSGGEMADAEDVIFTLGDAFTIYCLLSVKGNLLII